MRKPVTTIAAISTLIVGLALAPTLYARDSQIFDGSMMGPGMMGQGGMMNMMPQMPMRQMGSMGQMGQMGDMTQMMEQCSQMMQGAGGGSGKPNEQWRKDAPTTPEKGG